jgi:cytochrome c-type biogenesis protein CcmH
MASGFPFIMIGPRAFPRNAVLLSVAALLFAFLIAITGCVRESDITLEQRGYQLATELMCPVCDGQTIDGSSAQIALDMRAKVDDLLQEGNTNAEIKDYFVLRYGADILAAPEGSGFNLLAWIVPVFIVIGGIGIALIAVNNMRKSGLKNRPATTPQNNDLSDYLAQVDSTLGNTEDLISRKREASEATASSGTHDPEAKS